MRSFVKPVFSAKFGLAAVSSVAMVAAPAVVAPANASTFSVTSCSASGAGSLAAAIDSANLTSGADEVSFDLSSNCTVTMTSSLDITESVALVNDSGFEFTLKLHPSSSSPLINVEGVTDVYERVDLTIDGLVFDGDNVASGAALLQATDDFYLGYITVANSDFVYADSGAIWVQDQIELQVTDSVFYSNRSGSGGAIMAEGTPTGVFDSNFYANTATYGGSIAHLADSDESDGEQLLVLGSTFSSGNAIYGGAIWMSSGDQESLGGSRLLGNLVVQSSTFTDNAAASSGGAIFAYDSSVTLWGISEYTDVYYSGGATEKISTYGNSFTNNDADYGGAVNVASGSFLSAGNYFGYNQSTGGGGAIFVTGNQDDDTIYARFVSYLDSFYRNSASEDGGALNINSTSASIIAFSSIIGNSGYNGGAMTFSGNGYTGVIGNTVTENYAYNYGTMTIQNALTPVDPYFGTYHAVIANSFVNNSTGSITGRPSSFISSLEGTVAIGANIFANTDETETQLSLSSPQADFGANMITGPAVDLDDSGLLPSFPGAIEGESVMVTFDSLDLQEPAVNSDTPENAFPWQTLALGLDSIAIDYFDVDSDGVRFAEFSESRLNIGMLVDGRFVYRLEEDGSAIFGQALDVGAFELGLSSDPIPTDPNVVITDVSKTSISATGDTFSVYGRGLDDVTELYIGGVKVSFVVVSATELRVVSGQLPLGKQEILAIATDGRAVYQLAVGVVEEPSYWTKNLGNGQAKIYAKNIVGEGKVQFFLNGKEIAWINAVDETDPKLRKANGAAYLVRTVNLVAGKNRLEVKVDGVRVRFTTYTK